MSNWGCPHRTKASLPLICGLLVQARSLMCLPMWKNAEPREGEMIGILHIYRGNEEKFTRSDETIARMVALVAGPTLEQLVHVNELASQHEVGPDNARLLNEYGTRCISLALNDSMSAASCRTEMLQLTRDAEKLASIAVCSPSFSWQPCRNCPRGQSWHCA